MNIAVVGATGLVGRKMLDVLAERNFPIENLFLFASERSEGEKIYFRENAFTVEALKESSFKQNKIDIVLFSAGSSTSEAFAPIAAKSGSIVIDNSSYWRMKDTIPLVVPEVNPEAVRGHHGIIANPNCSTIQLVVVLSPIHIAYGLKRVVVSTYQSVTGSGKKAVDQLNDEIKFGKSERMFYPYPISRNAIAHIDVFLENGYTKEEMKIVQESRKILGINELAITATTVRIPTDGGHSESVNIHCENAFEISDLRELLAKSKGIVVQDNPAKLQYPMPLLAKDTDDVFVGRIRKDESLENSLNLWIVADNLRKGAATNAVQIAELLIAS